MYGYGYKYSNQSSGDDIDPDAQAYFDLIGDIPVYAQNAWNDFVLGCKAMNIWTRWTQIIPFLPTESILAGYTDAKTLTNTCTIYEGAVAITAPTYLTPSCWVGSAGANWSKFGIVRTGWNPSLNWASVNSTAYVISFSTSAKADPGYSWGADTNATTTNAFIRRSGANAAVAYFHGNTANAGSLSAAAIGSARGTFIMNRTASNSAKMFFNGVELRHNTGTQTMNLPNKQTYLNAYG
jgi:hypothetical protein